MTHGHPGRQTQPKTKPEGHNWHIVKAKWMGFGTTKVDPSSRLFYFILNVGKLNRDVPNYYILIWNMKTQFAVEFDDGLLCGKTCPEGLNRPKQERQPRFWSFLRPETMFFVGYTTLKSYYSTLMGWFLSLCFKRNINFSATKWAIVVNAVTLW